MRKHAHVPKQQLCAENPGIMMWLQGVEMDKRREIDEDLLGVNNLSEAREENLSVILREMSKNIKTLGESIKRLHEPELGLLGHES